MYFPFITAKSLTGFGAEHSRFIRAFPRLQMILVLACDDIDEHNRITIDAQGKPVVHYRFTPQVVHGLVKGAVASARIFFAAGAERCHMPVSSGSTTIEARDAGRLEQLTQESGFVPGKIPVSAAHLQGGCGMGRTSADSVTDSVGHVHGIPWLYVADASLFPNSLEINPYLTIMALADRTAETIRKDAPTLL
jgi:choline dehydrogenase-like flavoprotein